MGGIGSGHGTKRPDHPVGHWLRGRNQNDPNQKKHLKSVFSDKPDPSCHGHKRERDRMAGLPDHGAEVIRRASRRSHRLEEKAMEIDRRKTIAMEARDLQDLARKLATKAVQTLVDILDNENASDTAKIQAVQMLLDRGYGKPTATMNINQTVDLKATQLDDKSLDDRVADTLRRIERVTGREAEETEGKERLSNIRKYN